jgi:hypothetical protein
MTVYILGPMRHRPLYNFPAFDAVAFALQSAGHTVINPAALDRVAGFDPTALDAGHDWSQLPTGMNQDEVIDRDLKALRTCDAYVALDGWENSVGAKAEKHLLDWQGAQRLDPNTLKPWCFVKGPLGPLGPLGPHGGPGDPGVPGEVRIIDPKTGGQKGQKLQRFAVGPHGGPGDPGVPGEVRIIDPKTGGQKGQKLQRFDLIPGEPLTELAEVYGRGAKKYSDDNWRKGYSWKLSFGALNRHLWAWWGGEERDGETGNHHLACVAWHAFTLLWYQRHKKGTDDRPLLANYGKDVPPIAG